MGTMTNSQRLAEARKRREEEESKNSSSFSGSYRNSQKLEKRKYEREIGLDTFESDLKSMGNTINSIYGGWQTAETMSNTRSSIEDMQSRINTYQTYQSKYGGNDLSDLASGYQSVLDDWDKLTSVYGNYQNADAYNEAVKKAKFDEQFNGMSYDEVQSKKKKYAKDSDEYKYLDSYLNYTDLNDFDKAIGSISEDSEYKKKLQTSRNQYALDNTFDLYKDYMNEEDFEEKSQYVSTELDSKWKKLTSQYGLGYGDITYEYVNNLNGARDEIAHKASVYGMDSKDFASEQEEKGYDKLNEDEIAVYNYIYATEGKDKAQEFLDAMEVTLTKRVYDEATQRWEEIADSGAGASVALSALSVPANLIGGIYSFGSTVSDAIKGKEYNPYGYYKTPSNFAMDTREYVGENIEEATEGMEIFGQNIPSFLYQTGMSTADSAVGAMAFGKALAPVMGMSAYQQKAKELKEAGASEEEIQRGAIASGAFEMAFEYVSIDKLLKIKDADSFGKIVKESLKQAGIEGSEEMFTEMANVGWDYFNRQDSSEIMKNYQEYLDRGFTEEEAKQKIALDIVGQVGWAGVGGALSGGAMGSAVSVGNYSDLSATGKQIRANDRVQEMIDLQDLMEIQGLTPEQSEAYKLYGEYAQKGVNADTISNAQLGNLYQTSLREADATIKSRKATQTQKTDANKRLASLDLIATSKPANERARQQRVESLNKGEVTEVTATGNATTIEGIKIDDGNTIVLTSEGEVKAEDMTFSSKDAEILAYAEDMGEEKGSLLLAQYDGKADVESFVRSFDMAYAYGEVGMDSDSVLRNKGVLTEAQASEIYKTALTNKVNERQNAIDAINVKHSKNVFVEGKLDDSIIDYEGNATGKVAWKDLTKTQRDAITFVKGFSQATGVNITFIKSDVKDGKRVGKNGSYNPATNTIEIDVYAGIVDATSVKDSIIPTLSHEMTHWMKAKSPSMYSKIQTHALETLAMDGKLTSEERIASEMNRMKKNHPDVEVTEEMAIDEIVARYCEDMLSNSNKARKLINHMSKKEQNSFIAKVKETFNNLMEWVNELLAKYKSTSKEAEILRDYKARLKEVSKMWDKMLAEAIQTNQSLQAEGVTGEQVLKENETQWADRVEEEFNIDATIEQTDGMIAVHNLSEEKLLKTLKLGGFPMPSIAVTKASVGFKGFGSISILFSKDTIDPRFFRSNKVYSGDAWTPTYPRIDYKVNEKVEDRVRDKYYELAKRLGYDELRPLYRYAENLEDTLNRDGGENAMLERLYEDTGIMQIYLQDTGKDRVQPIEVETRTEISREEAEAHQSFIEAIGEELLVEFEIPSGENGLTYRKEFLAKHKDEVESAYRKVLVEHYELTEEEAQSELNATKPMKLLSIVRGAYMYTQNKGISVQTRVDTEATNNAIREASADGYKEWVDTLFKGVQEKTGIRNNKDVFTPSGNRRSWDTLHYEETLENIIKSMKEQGEKGVGTLGGNIFGASAKDLESIGEIKEAGKKLRAVSQDEYAKMKNAFMDRFNRIADSLRMHEGYTALDGACELLIEAVAKNNTRSGIANYIKKEGKGWTNYSEQIVDDLIELVNDIRNMPVNYFEAKPMRVVGFDEIAYAVIPDNASEQVRTELSNLNIPMKEYKAGDEDARVDVVNSVEGIQFSDRVEYVDDVGEWMSNRAWKDVNRVAYENVRGEAKIVNKARCGDFIISSGNELVYTRLNKRNAEDIEIHQIISVEIQEDSDLEDTNLQFVFERFVKEYENGQYENTSIEEYGKFVRPYVEKMLGREVNIKIYTRPDYQSNRKNGLVRKEEKSRRVNSYFGNEQDRRGNFTASGNVVKYSDRDSSGRQLTEEQQKFYEDSKIRDAEGNLKVMYHGSGASFTVFDKKKAKSSGYYGSGFYFTESESHANQYGSNYEVYLNIKNPMQEGTNNITKAQLKKFVQAVADNEDYGIENYGYGATTDSVANSVWGKDDFGMIMDINATCVGDMVEAIQLFNEVNGTTYDGIVVPTETVAFYANQIKRTDNLNPTKNEDMRYSDRDNVSIYDVMGEAESLKKQNALLKADVESLKERLKLERQVTNGNTFDEKKLTAVAKHLRNISKSDYSEASLVEELREVYSYIVETPQLEWEVLMSKSYDVARNVLNSSKGYKVTNDYFKSILGDIRKARITLNDEQIQEAKSAFGERYRDAFMGRVMLVKHGTSLDQKWQEWSAMYPEIFDADITGADQITALSDIYDSLREGAEMYQAYNDEESIRAFATEIYNQYWNVSTIRTTADKYEKQIKRINFEHRKAMGELREDYKKRVEDQKKADAIHYGKVISKIRQQRDAQVKEAKQLGKKRMDEYKDRLERNAKINSITAKALTLNQWLTKNSKDEHIPEIMKAPVAYLLNAIDFSSKQLLGMRGGSNAGMATKRDISLSKALEQVHDMVQKINSAQIGEDEITEIYGTFADFPAGFADDIRDLSSVVNDVMRTVGDNAHVLNQMSLEELETLDRIITIIKATATKMNKFLAIRHAEGVANLSQQSINYMDSLGKGKTHEGILGKVDKLLDWGNALPYYTFKRFGEGGQKVYEALQNGWDTFAFHVKEIIDYTDSVYTSKEVKEWSETVKEFDILEPATDEEKASADYEPTYQKVKMSVPQIMSLYCLQKREQAKSHLMGGGMRISDIETKKGIVTQSEGVILTHSEIDMIVESLTDRQRAVADELQKFMNTTCTDWGNEVSMLRFGFKAFGEENYFPIQSDKNNLAVNDETEQNNSLFRLLNMSFTKGTIKKANNRIVISDIFDVFAQHTSDMAKYNALALPVLDSFKWYNYKEKIKKGDTAFTTKSLKQSMENAFSKDAQNYFVTFLKDINGEQSAGRDVVGGGFFTNAKLASVGFNMRVVALQPTSYVRASAVIDNKYLAKAFIHKPKISMAEKHCGIALWKSLGFYDINIQNSVTDMIKGNQTVKDKIVDASMKGAEIADKVTWGYLWNACELEVRDKRKDLRVGSEEFYEAIGKRLREVIYSTQVVDSTMTRSHMMRSKDGKDKMLTAFMSEPTLAYNMLQDCYFDWKLTERQTGSKQTAFKKHGKKMARVITAYTVTNMICALVESGFDIFRDDDDEMTPEDFIKLYLKNFASDMSILNKIPYAKEVVSMLQGYSSSRTDTQWMQYMTYTITGIGKLIAGEGNVYTTAKNAMRGFSQMTGLPLYNAWRDVTALLDKTELLSAEELEEIFNDTIGSIFPSLKSK